MKLQSGRLTILKRMCAHLEQITPGNGYAYDLTGSVFRGRTTFGDTDPLPMLTIVEQQRPDFPVYAGANKDTRKERWGLVVQGFVTNDLKNPSDPAYEFMATVEHHLSKLIATDEHTGTPLYPEIYMLGPCDENVGRHNRLITSLEYGPGIVSPPREQVSSQAFFYMPFWLGLAQNVGKPFAAV